MQNDTLPCVCLVRLRLLLLLLLLVMVVVVVKQEQRSEGKVAKVRDCAAVRTITPQVGL